MTETGGRVVLTLMLSLAAASSAPSSALAADQPADQPAAGKLASMQNVVETRDGAASGWKTPTLNQLLHDKDRVRTGAASRAAILYSDQTLQRINEKSEVEILPPSAGNPGMLRVLSGTHYFSSRKPKDYSRIETPTVTAAIRGTEFVVEVREEGVTLISMLEGTVEASNEHGNLTVVAGEQAFVERGKAPVKRIMVRPRDAVAWSFYYPPVLGGADRERLKGMGGDGEGLVRAAEYLSSGQVDLARPLIAAARQSRPGEPVALALASVIEVAADRADDALNLARQAVEADGQSSSAALAMSFAAQAKFDIPRARETAETAARLAPDSAEALARVAELRMAEGDIPGARDAAERAVRRDPNSARALTVLGFIELAELRSADALATFEKAVAADPDFPMARLGFGIASIRRGNFEQGREEMQTAASLDPDNSLIRSYLAKAYYEEKREMEAGKELAAAKQLDPSDPTPYLYDAILKQTYNRPVEALAALQKSIELNDKRAVYRSRLLLDQDMAMRSADLASIYNDLGFEQLGMVTARRSADADQANYSSHLFLAGNYRSLPGFAPAFLSESLQARVYQPVNVNSVRPDQVNETASFNEYTSLIDQPRLRGYLGAGYGWTDTDLSELFDDGQQCLDLDGGIRPCEDIVELDESHPTGGDATVTYNQDRFAGSLSYRTSDEDGFRTNNDIANDVARGFFIYAPTYRDQIQLNFIDGHRETGDQPLREIPVLIGLERIETDFTNIGVSYRRVLSPHADLVFSGIWSDTEQTGEQIGVIPQFDQGSTARLKGPQFEAQYVRRQKGITWIGGAGRFDGEQELNGETLITGEVNLKGDDTFTNGYVYAKFRGTGPLEITAGASYEDLEAPLGLLPPRDANIGPAELGYEDARFSPKVSLAAYLSTNTVLRAAAYYRLNPAIGRLQTLEPTQVGGFNQFFDDPAGTWSLNYGVGVDQTFRHNLFAGLSVMRRDLDIPEPVCDTPTPTAGCGGQVATDVEERHSDDWLGVAYVNGTVGQRLALGLEYGYEERDFDNTQVSPVGLFEDFQRTTRLRPEARLSFPMGLFVTARGTRYDQEVDQFDDLTSASRDTVESDFWLGDLSVGYRLPNRWGSVTLDALNVTDQEFIFFRSSLEERVVPARTILLSVRFASN
ncbi:MAG: FecR domain-containing protein [Candidatus Polarisedimenticolia bacterium]